MTRHPGTRLHVLLLLLLLVLVPDPGRAQDLKYTVITRTELGGTTGRALGVMPGTAEPVLETTFIKGNRIRKDESPESSSVMDWDAGILTLLDHAARSYVQVSLEQMAEVAEAMAQSVEGTSSELGEAMVEGSQEGAREAETAYAEGGGDQASLDVRISSDRTGRTREFSGYSAEQVLITLEILGEHTPGEVDRESESGGLAIITELWLSRDFPEYRMMQEMDGAALARMKEGETGEGILGSLEALLTYDPRIKFAFEKNQETIDAMDGVALRTAMHVVSLPGWMPVDREQVLADQDRSLSDDAMDAAKSGTKDAAKSAVSQISGRLFGRKKEPEPGPEPPQEPQQSVIMRVISEVSDVELGDLDPVLFEPPVEYTVQTQGGEGVGTR